MTSTVSTRSMTRKELEGKLDNLNKQIDRLQEEKKVLYGAIKRNNKDQELHEEVRQVTVEAHAKALKKKDKELKKKEQEVFLSDMKVDSLVAQLEELTDDADRKIESLGTENKNTILELDYLATQNQNLTEENQNLTEITQPIVELQEEEDRGEHNALSLPQKLSLKLYSLHHVLPMDENEYTYLVNLLMVAGNNRVLTAENARDVTMTENPVPELTAITTYRIKPDSKYTEPPYNITSEWIEYKNMRDLYVPFTGGFLFHTVYSRDKLDSDFVTFMENHVDLSRRLIFRSDRIPTQEELNNMM